MAATLYNSGVSATPLPQPLQKNWISRHPALTVLVAIGIFGIFCLVVGGFVFFIFSLMGNSTPARMGVARAQANPVVIQQLGTPLKEGWSVTGSININNDAGHAELEIPVTGPRGRGEIYVLADKRFGKWTYSDLEISVSGSDQRINLLNPPEENQ